MKPGRNKVTFTSDGEKVSALLYLPNDYENGRSYPGVVVTPPATGVKEQTAGIYAQEMANRGFAAIAFDPRGWGESEGTAFNLNPEWQVRDVRNAVNYLLSLDMVDKNNVFNLGICMGSGWAAYETAFDSRINALAMCSPYLTDVNEVVDYMGVEQFRNVMVAGISEPASTYFETGNDTVVKVVPENEEEMKTADPISVGMRDYYLPGMPGEVPTWQNKRAMNGDYSLFGFSIFNFTKLFEPIPTYLVYGEEAVSKNGAIRFVEQAKPEKVTVIAGAGHFDLYWKPEHVSKIADEVASHFKQYMK